MRKVILLALALCVAVCFCPLAAQAEGETMDGNFVKITTAEDFAGGECTALEPFAVGDGALRLTEGTTEGVFLSAVYRTAPWNDLVASWNADTPRGTSVEIYARAYIPAYDGWSDGTTAYDGWTDWITWGEWSPYIERGCPMNADSHPRMDGETRGGWAFANSYGSNGDSSLNINGGLTAEAFQLKAVLRADGSQQAQPVLRLMAATFKNTDDPDWWAACSLTEEPVETPEAVLLDTPSLAQLIRDPDYGGVICSAVSMTMLLDGQGADLLPEEVALTCFDYGYGGNGNWSFTCAGAGAFGYESYVHYASFEGLRQELAAGHAVTLSVKYSNAQGGKYPYLQNAPTNTGGHLITIVGYYFNAEFNEYVYYSNDPATGSDMNTAHREYRESQLSEAWYRRAAYFVHEKEDGAGQYARETHEGMLWSVEGQKDVYALVTDAGDVLQLPSDFTRMPRESFGEHGTLALIVSGEEAELPESVRRVTANHNFFYNLFNVNEDGYFVFTADLIPELLAQGTPPTIFVIFNSGVTYRAVASADAPVYTPGMAIPTASPTAAPTDTPTATAGADASTGQSTAKGIWLPVAAGAAVVGAGAVGLLRKKKQ